MAGENKPTLRTEMRENVAWISLENEGGVHMLTEEFPAQLSEALSELEYAGEVRAIVLAGATKVFCAGADLSLVEKLREPEFGRRWLGEQHGAIARLAGMSKPTVAAVNGAAFGAGFNLALACDLVIASNRASFCQAFVRIGLATDMGSLYLLPRRVSAARARELMLTGRALSAEEALELGVVDELVDPERLSERCEALAGNLAHGPPLALAAIKRGMEQEALSMDESLELEMQLQLDILRSEDFKEGAEAFLEKREPNFSGR